MKHFHVAHFIKPPRRTKEEKRYWVARPNFLALRGWRQHKSGMNMRYRITCILGLISLLALPAFAAENPFLGYWGLTLPNGAAGWLGVEESNGQLKASLLWAVGSVEPTASAGMKDGALLMIRNHPIERKDVSGLKVKSVIREMISAKVDGDSITLLSSKMREDGKGMDKVEAKGQRLPPMPPEPDLSKVKFGEPIKLFNGGDLAGWRLTDPKAVNGWSAKDGMLVNDAKQEEGKPHKNYGNLRTDQEFEDFSIKLEVRLDKGGNSGVYLRGIYEVQVADSFGKPLDPHNMGAVYSRIKPTLSAEKPAGEWQSMDITLVERHVTVILNGKRIIDNQPVLGCTGGALWSDVTRPGPIYLQGDHTGSEYRNVVLSRVTEH
jgi:hypothetical protein